MVKSIILCICLLIMIQAESQTPDFSSIDGVINELYTVISGPAGERDWDQFREIFHENAVMGAMTTDQTGKLIYMPMTPESYIESNGPFFLERGFWEEETGREEQRFGELAHVYSAYHFRLDAQDAPVVRKGINSIQLIFEDERWWVISLQWNAEREGLAVPANLLGPR